ncbi:MAG TPA: hypothetical protein VN620_06625 [Candidatus Methylomirabilis sp.]|nr:hypothetical protein [Candidatus Methylomirabilis sp.]
MILGMSRSIFTMIHLLVSLAAICSGFVFIAGLLNRKLFEGWVLTYFLTSILTVLTGFLFPFDHLLRSHILGLLSLLVLTIAVFVRVISDLVGVWRVVYVVMCAAALYFNCFAAVVQLFAKIPALTALAPTGTEPPYVAAQSVVFALFVALTYVASKRFGVGLDRTM